MVELELDRVVGLARGYQEPRILLTASELGLFAILEEGPLSAFEIAEPRGWNVDALEILLDALTVMAFLEKCKGRYFVARVNRDLFSPGDSRGVSHIISHAASGWDAWSGLTSRITNGGELPETARFVHEIETMHAAVKTLAPGIAALVRPDSGRTFLDVAGGTGAFAIAFLDRNRSLLGTILERAEVLEVTRRHLSLAGYGDCVRLVPSDFISEPWPDGQDLVFLSAIIHTRPPLECQRMLTHSFNSLIHGGRIVIRDHIMSEDRLLPRSGAICSVDMLVTTNGAKAYTFSELRQWLHAEGFRDVRILQDGERTNGRVEAFKP